MSVVTLPTTDQIRSLHEQHAPTPEAFEAVWTHCRIVARIAAGLAAPDVDADLVRVGCLLHDIGVYRLIDGDPYIRHGIHGGALLRSEGFPEQLARFCEHHTGVGITADDVRRQNLPLPVADYVAGTPEEALVMYADKFHTKSTPPAFLTAAAYSSGVARFGPEKVTLFRAMVARYGEPSLADLAAEFGHRLIDSRVE